MKALSADLSSLEDELNSMKPPARDVKTVRNQQDDLSKFIKKVNKKKNVKNKIHIQHSTLIEAGLYCDSLSLVLLLCVPIRLECWRSQWQF